MTRIIQRRFTGESDKIAMADLARAYPLLHLHNIDLPYRFSSWAFDDPENVALWVGENDQILAWAVMQGPFWSIDYACHPEALDSLHRRILSWADQRARQLLGTPASKPAWFAFVFNGLKDHILELEEAGFTCQTEVGEDAWAKVWMLHSASIAGSAITTPEGFTIRPIEGEHEILDYVDLHREVFETKNMTADWRMRTLKHADYQPDLDLVAVEPAGHLAAFCIGWLAKVKGELCGQIEPLGVRQDFRGYGLGKAILTEVIRRLYLHGASKVFVETDKYRNTALSTYESAGFRVVQDVLVFRKDYQENQS